MPVLRCLSFHPPHPYSHPSMNPFSFTPSAEHRHPSMESGLCTSSIPFLHMTNQVIPLESLVLGITSVQGSSKITIELLNHVNILTVRYQTSKLSINTRQPISSVPDSLDSVANNYTLIFGYWMGPDIDDGWGCVEAIVDQVLYY